MFPLAVLLATTALACAVQGSYPIAPMRARVCTALCTSGLGGPPCGNYCEPEQAKAFNDAMEASKEEPTKPVKGPRKSVCPVLCGYGLGEPLCSCHNFINEPQTPKPAVDWTDVCTQFCVREGLTVYGCRPCWSPDGKYVVAVAPKKPAGGLARLEDGDDVDWDEWCHNLCESGDGGIACNCDINP